MAKPLSTTESPSSFIRYKDGYSEHTSGFTVCRDSEIKKSYHTLREKITKKKAATVRFSFNTYGSKTCTTI